MKTCTVFSRGILKDGFLGPFSDMVRNALFSTLAPPETCRRAT